MQIPDEIRDDIEFLDTWIGREPGGSAAWKAYARFRAWFNTQPAGELTPVESAQIDCACIAENCRHWLEVYRNNAGRISLRIHSKNGSSQAVSLPDNIRLYIHVPETTP